MAAVPAAGAPYLVAMLAAMLCAALARALMSDADTPAAPTLPQALAHALMLQDVLEQPALSAGVWYVAMDLQLFALLALLAALTTKNAHKLWSLALLVGTALASLCVFNLDSSGDIWAPYFFGAYALGVLTAWGANSTSMPGGKVGATALVGLLLAAALALEWRDRIALAGLTALILLWQPYRWTLARSRLNPLMQWLAKVSYAVFLLHYPVSMAVNALVMQLWPTNVPAHAAGLVASWALSLACGWVLWYAVEAHGLWLRTEKNAQGAHAKHAAT
ncbi:acyltransferase family protein [Ottowia sp. VDI28]|uniref:acyltransferase family protein n=1 Tax=Ottowia sp. VDI28 TaxID=3133968 RepID=UPI003C2D8583